MSSKIMLEYHFWKQNMGIFDFFKSWNKVTCFQNMGIFEKLN